MWNTPKPNRLANIPGLYATESIPLKEKLIHCHFFLGNSDWFVAEYDKEDSIFWGFTILTGDYLNAEWGYFSLEELKEIRINGIEVDCELEEHWQIRPASHIAKIAMAFCLQEPV